MVSGRLGKRKIVSQYALHIQCGWRMIQNNKIIIASGDMYVPGSKYIGDIDDFDWDVVGANKFDEITAELFANKNNNTIYVSGLEADEFGGVKLVFTENYILEIFPDESFDEKIV